jgi:hypothetical protein
MSRDDSNLTLRVAVEPIAIELGMSGAPGSTAPTGGGARIHMAIGEGTLAHIAQLPAVPPGSLGGDASHLGIPDIVFDADEYLRTIRAARRCLTEPRPESTATPRGSESAER